MDVVDKELIEQKFANVRLMIDSNHNEIIFKLEKILEQTLKTNGRVTELERCSAKLADLQTIEKETHFIRTVTRYPKFTAVALIGIASILFFDKILDIIKLVNG